jgi:hypothetical protein
MLQVSETSPGAFMRVIAATLFLMSALACASQERSDGAGPPAKLLEEMRAESLAAVDRTACAAAGGDVRQEGLLGLWRCVTPYADAGKPCRSKADCEGRCLAEVDAPPSGEIDGRCEADDSPFGCFAEVEDGVVGGFMCVD